MSGYLTELSKYFIAILTALYTFAGFLSFHKRKHKNAVYIRQSIYLFLIQFLGFFTLSEKLKDTDYLFFYGFVQVFLFAALILTTLLYENCNRLLLNNMCFLLGIGFLVLARISMKGAIKQLTIVVISFIIALFVPFLMGKIRFFKKIIWVYAGVGILLLTLVLILGNLTHGSKISFSLWGVTFQPSEFIKLVFIFFLACALYENQTFKRVVLTTVIAAAHVVILVVSKDLGSALLFFITYLFVVFMATGKYYYLLAGTTAGVAGAVAGYFLFDHIKIRVLAWQNPFAYIDAQGYQITQSLFAVGSGSWFGMGLGQGTPGDIPYVESDFIFSAVCEELGVIVGICLILICISCFLSMMQIGLELKDRFFGLIASGMGVIYISQIFLTIGGGIKFIPLTGVTLPFVSYGGSSVFSMMLLFFILQALTMKLHQEKGVRHV